MTAGDVAALVNPDGSRWWRFKYRVDGRENLISLGVYPAKSLKAARKARDAAKEQLAAGIDPSEQRKAEMALRRTARENTFKSVATEWFDSRSAKRANTHSEKILGSLEKHVYPEIGSEPIAKLTGPRLLEVLRKVQQEGSVDTAHRARQNLNTIFRCANGAGKAGWFESPIRPRESALASAADRVPFSPP